MDYSLLQRLLRGLVRLGALRISDVAPMHLRTSSFTGSSSSGQLSPFVCFTEAIVQPDRRSTADLPTGRSLQYLPMSPFCAGRPKAQEPVGIDAFGLKAALQSLDEGLVGGAAPREIPACRRANRSTGTVARHELAASINVDFARNPIDLQPLQRQHHGGAADGDPH